MTTTEFGIKNEINSCKQKYSCVYDDISMKGHKAVAEIQFSATVSHLYNQPMAVGDFPE